MNRTSHDELIRRLAPIGDDDATRLTRPRTRRDLAEHIMATASVAPSPRRRWLPRLGAPLATAAVAAAAALVFVYGMPAHRHAANGPAAARPAALTFSAQGRYLVVRVRDPLADPARYRREFAAHGMHIDLRLVPASPSVVGTVVESELPASITTIPARGKCFSGGGACPVGVKIPLDYHGGGAITFGRAARPGEQYASTNSAFAPGEALHCVDIRGRTVDDALRMLQRHKVRVALFHRDEKRPDGSVVGENGPRGNIPGTWYVSDADPYSPGEIMLWVQPDRPGPGEAQAYYERLMRGCPR